MSEASWRRVDVKCDEWGSWPALGEGGEIVLERMGGGECGEASACGRVGLAVERLLLDGEFTL